MPDSEKSDLPDLWVLTTAPGSRVNEVVSLLEDLNSFNNVVVTNPPDEIPKNFLLESFIPSAKVISTESDEFNISKWWDFGLDFIAGIYPDGEAYDVLMIESDARMSKEDIDTVRISMREHNAVLAAADWQNCLEPGEVKVRRDNSVWIAEGKEAWQSRLPGMAMIAAGEAGVRIPEETNYRFWFADDDREWLSRISGGTVLVGGTTILHNGTQGPLRGNLLRYAEEDKERFLAYWGGLPENGGIL